MNSGRRTVALAVKPSLSPRPNLQRWPIQQRTTAHPSNKYFYINTLACFYASHSWMSVIFNESEQIIYI